MAGSANIMWVGAPLTYATWNPSDKDADITLSNGNKTIDYSSGAGVVRATIGKSSGKWYWEVKPTINTSQGIGIANASANLNAFLGSDTNGWGYWVLNGNIDYNSGSLGNLGAAAINDIIGLALDMGAGTLQIYKNNTLLGTAVTGLTGTIYPAWGTDVGSAAQSVANFGATALTYTPPTGFNAGVYN